MRSVQFVREPGYTYDLFALFQMYFNRKKQRAEGAAQDEGTYHAYFEELMKGFGEVPGELLLFFGENHEGKCFLETYYLALCKKAFVSGRYSLEMVMKALSNEKRVLYQMTEFYFERADEQILAEGVSLQAMNQWIRESAYSDELKKELYSFYIDPAAMLQRLVQELERKDQWLSERYEAQEEQLKVLEAEFDYDYVVDCLTRHQKHKFDIAGFEKVYVSFSLCVHNFLSYYLCGEAITCIVGADYRNVFQRLLKEREAPDLVTLGNAISEQNRIDILNLIYSRKELTIKEVESALGFTTANAYYHLAILCKAGLLKTRNPGRTVWYSVNEKYFSALCELFGKYAR